ncbi:T9SS type A sorting domain-containing protein [Balneolales bacterium ANBcel1]|nr:T9SS type A sorting domain-containing protein [Balneolales bacterium ANBcel1]
MFSTAAGQVLDPPPSEDDADLVPLPWTFNFDDEEINWEEDPVMFPFEGAVLERIENPDKSGLNETDYVLRYEKSAGAQGWAGFFYNLPEPIDINEQTSFRMRVWSPRGGIEVMMKLEMQVGPESPEMFAEVTAEEEWVELEWDIQELAGEAPWDRVVVIADLSGDPASGGANDTWFMDHFEFVSGEPTSSEPAVSDVPRTLQLSQNYPNPFNPTTSIDFALPESSQVTLSVYNMLGQQVAVLEEGHLSAGQHSVTFDAAGFSSGVYLYRLQAGNQVLTRTLTLVK